MVYVIENDIPLPLKCEGKQNELRSTIERLDDGQSIKVSDSDTRQIRNRVNSSMTRVGLKFPGRKFACRKHDGSLRVWRTE